MNKCFKMIVNILHLNDWEYYNLVDNPEAWDYDVSYHKYRLCKITGKFQKFYTHCLGLNPPEYVWGWETYHCKPYLIKDKGVWKVKEK